MEQKPKNLDQSVPRNKFWDGKGLDYWEYEPGKRATLPPQFEKFYRSKIISPKGGQCLDIGGGTGKFAIPMSQDGLNVTLLEPSSGMRQGAEINLEVAKDTLKGEVILVEGESKKLDFPDASFDFVLAKGSIHHNNWAGIEKSFKEVARVLKREGFFLFQARSTKDSALSHSERIPDVGITAKDLKDKIDVVEHYFSREELERLSKENGFEIVVEPEEIIKQKTGWTNARWWVVYKKI